VLPPIKSTGLNIDLINLHLQDYWTYKGWVEDVMIAYKNNMEAIENPGLHALNRIREMLSNKKLILAGGSFLDYNREPFTSIRRQIQQLDSHSLSFFSLAATYGLGGCYQYIDN
jgi:hypothetical protein